MSTVLDTLYVSKCPHDKSLFIITSNTKTSANESNTLLKTKSE